MKLIELQYSQNKRISNLLVWGLILVTTVTSCSFKRTAKTPSNGIINSTAIPASGRVTLFSDFDITLTPMVVDPTFSSYVTLSNERAFFDFDKAQINNEHGADIYLFVGCGTDCSNEIITVNGAVTVLQNGNKSEPGYQECLSVLRGEKIGNGVDPVPGNYSCLQTNEGNIVQILAIEDRPVRENSEFVFEYHLWNPSQMP